MRPATLIRLFGLLLSLSIIGWGFLIEVNSQAQSVTFGETLVMIASALDVNENREIDESEIQNAIQLWISGELVPSTDQIITDEVMKQLIQLWISGTLIPIGGPVQSPIDQEFDTDFIEFSEEEALDALAFWTPERMAEAIPATPILEGEPLPGGPFESIPFQDEPEFMNPSPPEVAFSTAFLRDASERETINPSQSGGSIKRYQVTTPSQWPYSANGRVFFRQNGASWVCSASVVTSGSRRLLWTAGHCVHGGGREGEWSSKWIFVPGYDNEQAPLGRWAAKQLWTTTGWARDENYEYDFAAVVMWPQNGRLIQDVTGSAGIAWYLPRKEVWDLFGYPASSPFNGRLLWACDDARHLVDDSDGPGPDDIGVACDLTGGSSGGPWLWNFDSSRGGYINSVNSYGYGNKPGMMYGPYFGYVARHLWQVTQSK